MTPTRAAAIAALGLLALAAVGAADDRSAALRDLQNAVHRAIERAEPAVVCLRVSRSEQYRLFRNPGAGREPGRLGGFDADMARRITRTNPQLREIVPKLDLADPTTVPEFYGTGVVIDAAAGLVLTNFHVVRDATKVYVRLSDGRGCYADIFAADGRSDLAVLRLLRPLGHLQALPLGNGGALRKGDFVLALAHPYASGFRDGSPSVSWGIISNVRRRALGGRREDDYRRSLLDFGTLLQTDARLALGSSGGALVNLDGELVGMTAALAPFVGSEVAGGYAVPFDERYRQIIGVLKAGREVEYGILGVLLDRAPYAGEVRLQDVTRGSPADRAGLSKGDVIQRVGDLRIRNNDDLFLAISASLAGSVVELEVQSPGFGLRRVKVRLSKMFLEPQAVIAANRPRPVRGLRVEYTSYLLQAPGAKRGEMAPGVLVKEVVPGSAAAQAGLVPLRGIITHVNGREVNTPDEFYAAAQSAGRLELRLLNRAAPVTLP